MRETGFSEGVLQAAGQFGQRGRSLCAAPDQMIVLPKIEAFNGKLKRRHADAFVIVRASPSGLDA